MAENMYDDDSSPPESEDASVANESNETPGEQSDKENGEATEEQLALVPMHFFKGVPKPGQIEKVEVVEVYEGEVSVRCIYKKDDDKEDDDDAAADDDSGEEELASESAPTEAEDPMMV